MFLAKDLSQFQGTLYNHGWSIFPQGNSDGTRGV